MKFLVTTHKQHLANMLKHLERERERLRSFVASVERLEVDCMKLEQQITEAEARGVDGFDAERFMKRRAKS